MLAAKRFYMIRHGETVANAAGYAAGSLDSPLTERGRGQADMARVALESLRTLPDFIVHSQLSRAKDTAFIMNENVKLPLHQNNDLAEQCFGDWQGMSWPNMRSLIKKGQNPPNGETMTGFYDRALRGIGGALLMSSGTPLIVTHGGIFDAFLDQYGHDEIDVQNCVLYEFMPLNEGSAVVWKMSSVDAAG